MSTPPAAGDSNSQLMRALTALKDLRARFEDLERTRTEPIAIIGMGCRFPGANSPAAFWELLQQGTDAIRETPADRWDADAFYEPDPDAPGKVATRWGGFLDEVQQFDAAFFGIAPREAALMDPQQRLLLEVAWETLEDGGQAADRLAGGKTGVFVGVHSHSSDYYLMQSGNLRDLDMYSGTGTSHSVVSGRLSYLLDLRGPSVAVDTACSSSLVAIHLAVQSLRNRECTLALAGGVNIMLEPTFTVVASRMHMMSADGRCKPFDARADGFVRSEGCGLVLLKRLSDALASGDRILAVIRGSAVNQDGRSNGLTAPNSLSQQAVIRDALTNAGVKADQIGLIEAHGTGTPLGDPIEIEALSAVFGAAPGRSCTLGSAKANIGHLEGAAGVAGLIKAVLTLRHGQIPALTHFRSLNPHISLNGTPFVIPTTLQEWPAGEQPRYAGISSFGWSGTNAHVIIGEAPQPQPAAVQHSGPYLLPISARSPVALHELAQEYRTLLAGKSEAELAAICMSAALRRSHHERRLAIAGRTPADLAERLDAFLNGDERQAMAVGDADSQRRELLVFVFPGQGSQWPGMARQLLANEPDFRAEIERCEQAFAPYVDWRLTEQLTATESRLNEIDVIQPALFAIQVALAAFWRSRGVRPDAVVGHSMGEVAAAHVAGILSLDDAARIICRRSRLLRRISGRGAMAVVELTLSQAEAEIRGYEDRLAIAVSNSPSSTVLSGDPAALNEVMEELNRRNVFCRHVKVDVASHSPQVDPLRADLLAALAGVRPQAAATPFFSTVTARFEDGPGMDAEYWAQNLRRPVLFAHAVEQLAAAGHTLFVELSPHPILLPAVEGTLQQGGYSGVTVASLQRDSDEPLALTGALGALYAHGYPIDWQTIYPGGVPFAALPIYPWQRERHWIEAGDPITGVRRGLPQHPLLGWPIPVADATQVWENSLSAREQSILYEHRIGGAASLPASAYLDLMGAALGEPYALHGLRFERMLYLSPDEPTDMQVVLAPNTGNDRTIGVYSRSGQGWNRHASASPGEPAPAGGIDPSRAAGLREQAGRHMNGDAFYAMLAAAGVMLGSQLQRIVQIWQAPGEVLAEVAGPASGGTQLLALDVCLQAAVLAAPIAADGTQPIFMPVAAERVQVYGAPSARMWCHAQFQAAGADHLLAQVMLYDDTGRLVAVFDGLQLQRSGVATARPDEWFYELAWRVADPPGAEYTPAGANWLVFADQSGIGAALARQLEAQGAHCLVVTQGIEYVADDAGHAVVRPDQPADLERLLAEALSSRACDGVVYLWGLDAPAGDKVSAADLERSLALGCGGLLVLVQALRRTAQRAPIWLVTQGAQQPDGALPAVAQAPLWGLGRSLAEELPDLWGGLVDIDPTWQPDVSAAALAREFGGAAGDSIVLRDAGRYAPRLVRSAPPPVSPVRLRSDATYLITGGFGALGAQVARRLVSRGARRLILMGRTTLPARAAWAALAPDSPQGRRVAVIRELERMGAAVHVAALDVGDVEQLRAFLDAFRAEGWPPIAGVIHTAAVFEHQLIHELDPATLWNQMRAKLLGAWMLNELLGELDLFMLFSSVAALLPQPGQAGYAAANSFLDALAQWRVARGLPGVSVNWGVWADSGMLLADAQWQRRAGQMAAQGLGSFTLAQGLEAMERLLQHAPPQVAFVPIHPPGAGRPAALLAEVWAADGADRQQPADTASGGSLRDRLIAADPEAQRGILEELVRRQAARVLKLSETRIDPTKPLGALGLDSLMAIDLRNRLEAETGLKLSATLAWNYPTVADLASYLLGKLDLNVPAGQAMQAATAESAPTSSLAQIVAAVDELADDAVILALMGGTKS